MKSQPKKIFKISLISFAVIFIISFLLFSQTDEFVILKVKFQSCPYGHHSLKAVPISYGFPIADSTYFERVENYEIYPGGCIISDDNPKYQIICTTCGAELLRKDTCDWIRVSEDKNSFDFKLNPLIYNFPLFGYDQDMEERFISYRQEIIGGDIISETVNFTSSYSLLKNAEFCTNFCNGNSISLIKNNMTDSTFIELDGTRGDTSFCFQTEIFITGSSSMVVFRAKYDK